MKTTLKLPNTVTQFGRYPVICGYDYRIVSHIEIILKKGEEFGLYLAPLFLGLVWFDNTLGNWAAEVIQDGQYMGSYLAETLIELADEINSDYGNNKQVIFKYR